VKFIDDEPLSTAATTPFQRTVRDIAPHFGLQPQELESIGMKESAGNQAAIGKITKSGERAIGAMQLMPQTAAEMGVDPRSLQQNVEGGARYYRQMLDKYGGDRYLAQAAYNAGPGTVDRYGGVPPFRETQQYVRDVQPNLVAQAAPPPSTPPPEVRQPAPAAPLIPVRFDESVPQRAFALIQQMAGAPGSPVRISAAQNVRPSGGGQRVVAVQVIGAPDPRLNGYWTPNGLKLSNDQVFEEAGTGTTGAGGGGSWSLRDATVNGRPVVIRTNSATGESEVVSGVEPMDRAGISPIYGKNLATSQSGWFAKEGLIADPSTGIITNRQGQKVIPLTDPEEKMRLENTASTWMANQLRTLENTFEGLRQANSRGELAAFSRSWGVELPASMLQKQAASQEELSRWFQGQKQQIDIAYWDRMDLIRSAAEGVQVTPENSIGYQKRRQYGMIPFDQQRVNRLVQPAGATPNAAAGR